MKTSDQHEQWQAASAMPSNTRALSHELGCAIEPCCISMVKLWHLCLLCGKPFYFISQVLCSPWSSASSVCHQHCEVIAIWLHILCLQTHFSYAIHGLLLLCIHRQLSRQGPVWLQSWLILQSPYCLRDDIKIVSSGTLNLAQSNPIPVCSVTIQCSAWLV